MSKVRRVKSSLRSGAAAAAATKKPYVRHRAHDMPRRASAMAKAHMQPVSHITWRCMDDATVEAMARRRCARVSLVNTAWTCAGFQRMLDWIASDTCPLQSLKIDGAHMTPERIIMLVAIIRQNTTSSLRGLHIPRLSIPMDDQKVDRCEKCQEMGHFQNTRHSNQYAIGPTKDLENGQKIDHANEIQEIQHVCHDCEKAAYNDWKQTHDAHVFRNRLRVDITAHTRFRDICIASSKDNPATSDWCWLHYWVGEPEKRIRDEQQAEQYGFRLGALIGAGVHGCVRAVDISNMTLAHARTKIRIDLQGRTYTLDKGYDMSRGARMIVKIGITPQEERHARCFSDAWGIGPKCVASWSRSRASEKTCVRKQCLVMERWDTTLYDWLHTDAQLVPSEKDTTEKRSVLNAALLDRIWTQMRTLHTSGYMHGDPHFNNIFIRLHADGTFQEATLADFGLSRSLPALGFATTRWECFEHCATHAGMSRAWINAHPEWEDIWLFYSCITERRWQSYMWRQKIYPLIESLKKNLVTFACPSFFPR